MRPDRKRIGLGFAGRGLRAPERQPPDRDPPRGEVEKVESLAVGRRRRIEGSARDTRQNLRGAARGRVHLDDVPDSRRCARDEQVRAVGAPRRSPRRRSIERNLAGRPARGRQRDEPPAASGVKKDGDPFSVGRNARMAPDGPRLRRGQRDRDLVHGARRKLHPDERGRPEAAAHGHGPVASRCGVRVADVGAAAHAEDAARSELPAIEVDVEGSVGRGRAAGEENRAAARHPARIRAGMAVDPRKRPARPRSLSRFLAAGAAELPHRQLALVARWVAPRDEPRPVGRDLGREGAAPQAQRELPFGEALRLQTLLLVEGLRGQLGAEPVVERLGRVAEDRVKGRLEASPRETKRASPRAAAARPRPPAARATRGRPSRRGTPVSLRATCPMRRGRSRTGACPRSRADAGPWRDRPSPAFPIP